MAAGVSLCAIELGNLQICWHVGLLTGAENGIVYSPIQHCILAVGDFDVTRIDLNGDIQWASHIATFLTSDVTIDDQNNTICDDRGGRHLLDIDTGTKRKA